ncbi:amidohydrolase [Phyllobacterium salinisoli]|uniref:Amidohydrolase n=1 Tax=Phyllobacterium salinisoli TaxID=1899321 RepID=A0A368K321_9HYPH|nr:amidohydrolase [Phyllobacterium salinisoli]RCS23584.1 amidohydrolase [Phyllobacterium salinisoli]
MFIDTHLHIIDRQALAYPWLAGVPALDRDFLYSQYAQEAERVGIKAALHMEVDVTPGEIAAETNYIRGLSAAPGNLIIGAISSCRPEEENFPAFLERCKADPFIKGFRRVLHVMPDDLSEQALFRENVKRLDGSGFTFDLCVLPHQIPRAATLADLAQGTQFVLDHCGVPAIAAHEQHPWRENIAEIARRPNVIAKISGVVAYADAESWKIDTLAPYVEHVVGCFGWDRVVWGSDWPVCTLGGGLSTWVAATHALFAGASEDERRRLFSENAQKLWKLELPA